MSTARRLLLLCPAGLLALAALLPARWDPGVPLCAVRALTGLDCPGCGMTRAFLLIAHGRLGEALALHPASPAAFLIVAGMAVAGVVRAARSR